MAYVNPNLASFRQCALHKKSELLYCETCICSLCSACHTEQHMGCISVILLSAMAPRLKVMLEGCREQLRSEDRLIAEKLSNKKNMLHGLTSRIDQSEQDATQYHHTIGDIDKLASVLELLNGVRNRECGRLIRSIDSEKINQARNEELMMLTETKGFKSGDIHDKCEAYKTFKQSRLSELYLAPPVFCQVVDVEFCPQRSRYPEMDLGEADSVFLTYEERQRPGLQPGTILLDIIDTKIAGDSRVPFIHGIVALKIKDINVVVVSDYANRRLKSFFSIGTLVYDSMRLNSPPWNVTVLHDLIIAVAVPDEKAIHVISVTPHLKLKKTISVSKKYHGLASLGSEQLVAGAEGCVDIINTSGEILLTVQNCETTLLKYPFFLSTIEHHTIIVSDCGTKTVTFLTQEGCVKAQKTTVRGRRFHQPVGVSSNNNGDVVVVDRNANLVLMLDSNGDFVADILSSSVQRIRAVHIDGQDRVYLTQKDRCVHVFQLLKTTR